MRLFYHILCECLGRPLHLYDPASIGGYFEYIIGASNQGGIFAGIFSTEKIPGVSESLFSSDGCLGSVLVT